MTRPRQDLEARVTDLEAKFSIFVKRLIILEAEVLRRAMILEALDMVFGGSDVVKRAVEGHP